MKFNLVREVGQEREVVFRNAPHLVKPMPILLPLTPHGQLGPLMTSLGFGFTTASLVSKHQSAGKCYRRTKWFGKNRF